MKKKRAISPSEVTVLLEEAKFDSGLLEHAMVRAVEKKISKNQDFSLDDITISVEDVTTQIHMLLKAQSQIKAQSKTAA